MTKVNLEGLHIVKVRSKSGKRVEYHYAFRGGPRLTEKPGTAAYLREFQRFAKAKPVEALGSVSALIEDYRRSAKFLKLATSTKRSYTTALDRIGAEFGTMPIEALEERGSRAEILLWRDEIAAETPRTADNTVTVFARVLAIAVDREMIMRHPLQNIEKVSKASRRDVIWLDDQIQTIMAKSPQTIREAFLLALHSGQRKGDLMAMTWDQWDGEALKFKQGKTGAVVHFKPHSDLRNMLNTMKRPSVRVLTNQSGVPWSGGFDGVWRKNLQKLNITGLTFHDLRGTYITTAYRNGTTIPKIAEVSGHSERDCQSIIRQHYLATDVLNETQV